MSMRDLLRKVSGGKLKIVGQEPEKVPIMTLYFKGGAVLIEPAGDEMRIDTMRMVAAAAVAELDMVRISKIVEKHVQAQTSARPNGRDGEKGGNA
jgi:hypothetical protein